MHLIMEVIFNVGSVLLNMHTREGSVQVKQVFHRQNIMAFNSQVFLFRISSHIAIL